MANTADPEALAVAPDSVGAESEAAAIVEERLPAKVKWAYGLGGTTDIFGHWLFLTLADPVFNVYFGLTPTEAGLARAIQSGISFDRYARERAVSLNTVYTHLRRLKEKTGCKRLSELIRKLNDLQAPLRLE